MFEIVDATPEVVSLGVFVPLKDTTNTFSYISKNAAASNDEILQDKLTELNLKKRELQDEYEFCSEELQKLKNQKPLNSDDYKNIVNEFM